MSNPNKNFKNKQKGSTGLDSIPREANGEFAFQGGLGKIKVPTAFSGPAKPKAKKSLLKKRIFKDSIKVEKSIVSASREIAILPKTPSLSNLEKAYLAYQDVRQKGISFEIKELVLDLENLLEEIYFVPATASDEEWSVAWCADAEIARDNSKQIARAIHDALEFNLDDEEEEADYPESGGSYTGWFESIDGWIDSILTIAFEGPVRREVVCGNIFISPEEGSEWIIDYSARQWDPRAPFPLVQPRALWEAWVRKHNEGKIFLSTKIGA